MWEERTMLLRSGLASVISTTSPEGQCLHRKHLEVIRRWSTPSIGREMDRRHIRRMTVRFLPQWIP